MGYCNAIINFVIGRCKADLFDDDVMHWMLYFYFCRRQRNWHPDSWQEIIDGCSIVKPVLRDHCHKRPPILPDLIFLAEGSIFQCKETTRNQLT